MQMNVVQTFDKITKNHEKGGVALLICKELKYKSILIPIATTDILAVNIENYRLNVCVVCKKPRYH